MMRNAWKSKLVGLLTLGLLTACGGVQGPTYEGEPLAVFNGHLIAQGQVGSGGQVRMALAWYSHFVEDAVGSPAGITMQDVVYEGAFPLNYTFTVTQPPPPEALTDLSSGGGPKKGAVGFLLAYEDRNGNGKLDTIPASGQAVDKVLGVSLDAMATEGFGIVYVAEKSQSGDPLEQSLDLGFNLVRSEPGAEPDESLATKVPLATSIPINLTGHPFLNLMICEELLTAEGGGGLSTMPCGIELHSEQDGVLVDGHIELRPEGAQVFVEVLKDDLFVAGTTVSIDGTSVPGDGLGRFELSDESGTLLTAGAVHTVTVNVPGEPQIVESVRMPGDFVITPGNEAVLPAGQRFSASWTAAPNADRYMAIFRPDFDFDVSGHFVDFISTTFETPHVIDSAGSATFSVTARSLRSPTRRIAASFEKSIRVHFQ